MLRIATGLAFVVLVAGCSSKDDPAAATDSPRNGSGGTAGAGGASTGGGSGGLSNSGGFMVFGDASLPSNPRPEAGPPVDSGDCRHFVAIIRDFTPEHPDFELPLPDNQDGLKGMVEDRLVQGYPAYALAGSTPHSTGADEFAQWYADTPGVNERFEITLPLVEETTGHFVYDNTEFFPIDGQGFGNGGEPHNFHFTTEVRTRFVYRRGQTFTFRGDDDLWVFVNDRLAMDLGGLHPAQDATIVLDDLAGEFGLVPGESYPMSLFHAERHTDESNFRIETSIDCFVNIPPPAVPR